ncbi:hypothetical protein ACA910_006137 [Epithemia clementina (nom. ined.)]
MALSMMIGKVFSAAGIVLLTTLDDAVWLVPFVVATTQSNHRGIAVLHGMLFVATLQVMAMTVCLLTWLSKRHLLGQSSDTDLALWGALLCWSLAAFLLYRSIQKQRRRRRQKQEQQALQEQEDQFQTEQDPLVVVATQQKTEEKMHNDNDEIVVAQPWMVCSLTVLGSLDEISYFPSLLLAGVFTEVELCLGTLLAAVVMLAIVVFFLRPCQPLMECFDRIPLYGVVTLFAILLTADYLWDLWKTE